MAVREGPRVGHDANKRSSGQAFPVCAGSQVLAGFNDRWTYRAFAGEVVVGNSDEVSAGSNKKLRWRCEKGHEGTHPRRTAAKDVDARYVPVRKCCRGSTT